AKQWRRDLVGPGYDQGALVKKTFGHKNNAGMQGFVFNTRRDIFKDPKVRRALGLAFDFEWTNRTLFFDQYSRANSYFSNSQLAAKGLPVGEEKQILEKYRDVLPVEVFSTPLTPPSTVSPASLRGNLRLAKKLLNQAGWSVRDGVLKNKEGVELSFEILLNSSSFERVMAPYVKNLKKLGVKASCRRADMALYIDRIKQFDFDMVVAVFGQAQSPGNEQRSYWHSSSAVTSGSSNLAGVDDPVVDALVEKIIYADTMEGLSAACRALDRVLWYGYYVVPNWYLPYHRLTYSSRFHQPEKLPLYYNPYLLLMTWWD
ncbi:MAG: ABC transporter substrate-binding protein, partial [Desulfobulbaceae bacterium]|nr:ABC transporter substrate-binding protein [Desulfobulbaceae bacterium]